MSYKRLKPNMFKMKLLIFLPNLALPTVTSQLTATSSFHLLRTKPWESYIQSIRTSCQFYLQNMSGVRPLLTSPIASTLVPAIVCPDDYNRHLTDSLAFTLASPPVYSQHTENIQRDPFKTCQIMSLLCLKSSNVSP